MAEPNWEATYNLTTSWVSLSFENQIAKPDPYIIVNESGPEVRPYSNRGQHPALVTKTTQEMRVNRPITKEPKVIFRNLLVDAISTIGLVRQVGFLNRKNNVLKQTKGKIL